MKEKKCFENYPAWIVFITNLVYISVHLAGLYLVYLVWPVLVIPFLIYLAYIELSIYKHGCVNCYYYGKICAFGRGKIAKILLKKGDSKKFTEKTVSFKDFLPSSMPIVITLIAGIYLLLQGFSWIILILMLWPVIVMFAGNPVIYGELACQHCKQCKIGCPVSEFFMKRAKNKGKRKK